jgi:hypothetical protein
VKEAAITCVGVAVAALGDGLGDALGRALGLLLERLRNEMTRLAAGAYTRPISSSTLAVSDTKYTSNNP